MSTPASELPADRPDVLLGAVDDARRGVVTHITVKGERVGAIVAQSTLAMSDLLTALLADEQVAQVLPSALTTAFPWAVSLPPEDIASFSSELREAVASGPPSRVDTVLFDWHLASEVRDGERTL
jgi:hypothetical protein